MIRASIDPLRVVHVPVKRHNHVVIASERFNHAPGAASAGGTIQLWLLPSGIARYRHQHHLGIVRCRRNMQGIRTLQAFVDQFPVLALVVTAVGASGGRHIDSLRLCGTQVNTMDVVVCPGQLLPGGAAVA